MTERQQLPRRNARRARSGTPRRGGAAVRHPDTLPTEPPPVPAPPSDPTLLGFPAEFVEEADAGEPTAGEEPVAADESDAQLVVLRRPDPAAGTLLLLAGAAGGMSLFLPWARHGGVLGVSLVELAFASPGVDMVARSGLVLPVAVALGGGLLFLLGLLAFRPARTHRATGLAALIVALLVAAGVVVRVADGNRDVLAADPGILCAVVLAGAGVLGALKAMLTAPEVAAEPG